MNLEIIEKVREYCKNIMDHSRCKRLQFHNWQHTKDVVQNAEYIAKNENLSEETIEELIISSYFHDLGNAEGAAGHEKLSCEFAQEFLTKIGYDDQRIINIIYNIRATEMPQQPETISQKVICDADLAHLGKTNFLTKNSNLRKEWEMYNDITFTDEQWVAMNLSFLSNHCFHTDFARKNYETNKLKNIQKLKSYQTV